MRMEFKREYWYELPLINVHFFATMHQIEKLYLFIYFFLLANLNAFEFYALKGRFNSGTINSVLYLEIKRFSPSIIYGTYCPLFVDWFLKILWYRNAFICNIGTRMKRTYDCYIEVFFPLKSNSTIKVYSRLGWVEIIVCVYDLYSN